MAATYPVSGTASPRGYITFQGIGFETGKAHEVSVLAGDTPPTVTDGYANWQTIPRPLSRGISVFQGYNPATIDLSVRFGRWDGTGWLGSREPFDYSVGAAVESDIDWIGWMAGEQFIHGASPVVYVSATNPDGTSGLIPKKWQGSKNRWVISKLAWGATAWRNDRGDRFYQEATITLLQYINYSAAPRERTQQQGSTFVTTAAINTALKIAAAQNVNSPPALRERLAQSIINAPQNARLRLRHTKQQIRPNTSVYVPAHRVV